MIEVNTLLSAGSKTVEVATANVLMQVAPLFGEEVATQLLVNAQNLLAQEAATDFEMTRRGFLQFLGGATGAKVTGIIDRAANSPWFAEGEGGDAHHNPNHISQANLQSAKVIGTLFGTLVGGQVTGEITGFKAPETWPSLIRVPAETLTGGMSPKTVATMATAWAGRLGWLMVDSQINTNEEEKIGSKHAYEHELAELTNVPIALGLSALSELTSMIEYRETPNRELMQAIYEYMTEHDHIDIFKMGQAQYEGEIDLSFEEFERFIEVDPNTLTELSKLDQDHRRNFLIDKLEKYVYSEAIESQFSIWEESLATLSDEQIREKISEVEERMSKKIVSSSLYINTLAPIFTTFTTATIADNLIPQIALLEAERSYLELWLSQDKLRLNSIKDLRTLASQQAVSRTRSSKGFVNYALTTAGNISGMGGIGDPPQLFFWAKYGLDEWFENSVVKGWPAAFAINASLTAEYLKLNGLPVKEGYKGGMYNFAELGSRIFKPFFDISGSRLNKAIEQLHKSQSDVIRIDILDNLTEQFNRIGRLKFPKAGEIFSHFNDVKLEFVYSNEISSLKEMLFGNGKEEGFEVDLTSKEGVRAFFDSIGMEFEDQQHFNEYSNAVNSIVETVLYELEAPNTQEVEDLFVLHGFPRTDRSTTAMVDAVMDTLARAEESGHHGISHSAAEVRDALLTQLWAVGSLQVISKKFLGLDREGVHMTEEEMMKVTGAVLGIIAGSSAVADNVAAMLFGIDVLETLGKNYFGDTYEDDPEIGKQLRRYALWMSIVAGSLSKIGNGPNMSIRNVLEIIKLENPGDDDVIRVMRERIKLGKSFTNVYSWTAVAEMWAWQMAMISKTLKQHRTMESVPLPEEAPEITPEGTVAPIASPTAVPTYPAPPTPAPGD